MAQDSQTPEVISTEAHLQFAVRLVETNVHLRVLFRHILSMTSVVPPASVFDLNPVQNAYNQGVQAAGLSIAELLTSVAPSLVATLMQEELTNAASE